MDKDWHKKFLERQLMDLKWLFKSIIWVSDFRLNKDTHNNKFYKEILFKKKGQFLMTNLLLDLLKASAPCRVVQVSALAGKCI